MHAGIMCHIDTPMVYGAWLQDRLGALHYLLIGAWLLGLHNRPCIICSLVPGCRASTTGPVLFANQCFTQKL